MFSKEKQKRTVGRALAENVGMRQGLKHMRLDVCSASRRAITDCLLKSLRYAMLLSRSSALTVEQLRWKKRKVAVAKRKLLGKVLSLEDIATGW